MTDRTEWTILGRKIGTATGWDEADNYAIILLNFEPYEKFKHLLSGDLVADYETGKFRYFNNEGETIWELDMIEALTR